MDFSDHIGECQHQGPCHSYPIIIEISESLIDDIIVIILLDTFYWKIYKSAGQTTKGIITLVSINKDEMKLFLCYHLYRNG